MVLLQFFYYFFYGWGAGGEGVFTSFFVAGVGVGRVVLLVFFFNGWGCVQEFIFTSFYGWGGG